ncbi:recombinase family protein [Streptomyces sp. Li-HN-5-11]|uniref:recombinase family protein n=1 Tax=Streptomyces sp. Li-HN-5-11 TaxID=3075432 RepID=UPI0028AF73E4|nr:recombinase family protein [Streptomyces sp. Li-HN-5-11]WNM34969.1 recombinase family protein [Streptomyces sp. Li-HN-5-11]
MRAYGHETDGVTAVPEEAAHLVAAARRLLEEKKTLAETADWMTENAGPTVSGRSWSPTTLRRRLRNPAIAGLRENAEGELVPGPAEPLVDRETFDALQELFQENRRGQGTKPRHVHYLSGGPATCALCKQPLTPRSTANGGRGYVCESEGCGKVRISAEPLDEYVGERVVARLSSTPQLKRLAAIRDRFAAEAREAERFLKELKGHKEELAAAYGAKEMNLSEFRAAKAALEKRRGEAMTATRRGRSLDELPELTPQGLETWWHETAGREQRRNLVQLTVREVRVGPATVRGSRKFDESRFEIFWR